MRPCAPGFHAADIQHAAPRRESRSWPSPRITAEADSCDAIEKMAQPG
ncbi:MAG: hypothetical protein AVDCRST_MAG89-815 [uncultured Gemmatimonadetes bacterium]|uniref:Uncharacterized protein n=1 Tax=uncultured Gemmatimonadota bacterium TaxID=203437 RepID=A0A6J4KI06_9BACT|nr:MAG: hypothetical protein AVDCRST_MAG89-815 [uncultured Gemmatimonadota bacterium]